MTLNFTTGELFSTKLHDAMAAKFNVYNFFGTKPIHTSQYLMAQLKRN